jgi:hypothetical protein
MPVRDPAGAAVLERRYRRLLRCYPPAHRALHREEMLGVLLTAARPGQRTPGLRETVNLAACGLVIRVRRIPGWLAADAGQDALAVVSLIVPVVVFILLILEWGAVDAVASARDPVRTGDTDAARSANGPATATTRSGRATAHARAVQETGRRSGAVGSIATGTPTSAPSTFC